ncbi:Rieske 2Fe-2S domain-containing protein [Kitasatospora kifunensis]|uniref:Thiosulfate dehydrogenase [quinone] large subunit n=1 Tax=Kitasatospora kifunensis TaxID=58351 RepID=A0A7W7R4F9_KITKI|nr:Rieske 2Fe-2S domain-containing protein [Kitasatospora kifunensis]MBB4925270.1 thiosulfate dehydrogenase [quinone] large subunit [Kitasatospora kifunensis]
MMEGTTDPVETAGSGVRPPAAGPVPPGREGRAARAAQRRAFAGRYALLPVRLFLGATFTYAGLDKLADSHYLAGAGDPQSFYAQTLAAKAHSPIGWALAPALHQPTFFGLLIAFGELAVGLGTLCGLWGRVAALGGAMLSLTLFLSVSFHVTPYYLGNDLPYLMAWTTLALAGTPYLSVDGFIAGRAERDRQRGLEEEAVRRRGFLDGSIAAVALGGAGLLGGSLTATFIRRKPKPTAVTSGAGAPSGAAKASVAVADVPVGGSATVTDPASGDAIYIVQPTAGQYCGLSSVCTHAGCAVDAPKQGQLHCPCHGSKFDAATGAVLAGPAVKPLPRYKVTRDGDRLDLGPLQS